jgi:hypothetical protein
MVEQVVYLGPDTTEFATPCEICLWSHEEGSLAARHRAAKVTGSLRNDVDVGFRSCRRGHRIVIRRLRLVEAPPAAA